MKCCKYCGTKLPDSANYCDVCGEPCINVRKVVKHEVAEIGLWLILISILLFTVVLMVLPIAAFLFL